MLDELKSAIEKFTGRKANPDLWTHGRVMRDGEGAYFRALPMDFAPTTGVAQHFVGLPAAYFRTSGKLIVVTATRGG